MMNGCRLVVLLLAALALSAASLPASTITVTLPEFNGPLLTSEDTYPRDPVSAGTFSYAIPENETIVFASISGTYGNSWIPCTCPSYMDLDGAEVGSVGFGDPPTYEMTPWSCVIMVPDFPVLADGTATLWVTQTSFYAIRLGETTLSIQTEVVPEPATAWALLSGLAGLGLARRRRS